MGNIFLERPSTKPKSFFQGRIPGAFLVGKVYNDLVIHNAIELSQGVVTRFPPGHGAFFIGETNGQNQTVKSKSDTPNT